jgi:transposase
VENYNLPKTDMGCRALALVIGTDGRTLLDALEAAAVPRWLREIPAVQTLRRVWAEQYIDVDGPLVWRDV